MNTAADPVPLFGPEMLADPYPFYLRLRSLDPVYWSARFDAWMVTGFDEVAAGLNDLRLSSDRSALFQQTAGSAELDEFFTFLAQRMVLAHPPKHTRLRGLVSKAFTPHADRLDVTRAVHKHVAFGLGHHFCLGTPLARLEAQIAFETMLRRLPNLRLAADQVAYRDNFNLRGLQSLPVALG